MSANIPKTTLKRVVIIGGGFGGLQLAKKLDKNIFEVVLVDRCNYHQFQPLLYQVATSALEPGSIAFPFRKDFQHVRNLYFRLANLLSIDKERKIILTTIGEIEYDYLVLATGTTTNYFGMDRIRAAALPMKSIAEAMNLRNAILLNLEKALVSTDVQEIISLLTVVIVGGGATGVEIAGALAEMKSYVIPKDYPDLKGHDYRIILVEGTDRLLSCMSMASSENARLSLEKMGVELRLSCRVTDYVDGAVVLGDGEMVATQNLIWVSGVAVQPIEGLGPEVYGRGGRIKVNGFNMVDSNLFVIGDAALISEDAAFRSGHPQVAQVAIQQGERLANNLLMIERGLEPIPFRYNDKGSMATIGRNRAVVDLHKIHFTGFLAWAAWMLVHLLSILGMRNKVQTLLTWMWSYITYDQSLRLIFRPTQTSKSEENK